MLWTSIPQGSSEALISVELPSSCHGNTGYTQKTMSFREVDKSVVLILFLSARDWMKKVNKDHLCYRVM